MNVHVPRRRWRLGLLGVALLLVLAIPSAAFAIEQRSGDAVTVTETINDDLYVFGNSIDVPGDVNGDVVAFGQSINISGNVSGDVIAAGQSVRVSGPVGGSIRAAGADVEIDANVAEDAVLAGATLRVASGADIGRDVAAAGGTVALAAPIGRNVLASAGTLTIANTVGGNVEAQAEQVRIARGASVSGDVTYWSNSEAEVNGTVTGQVTRHEPPQKDRHPGGAAAAAGASAGFFGVLFGILGWIRLLVGMFLFGLLFVLLFRRFSEFSSETLLTRPWPSLGVGAAVLFGSFPVTFMVFIIGLIVGGWWIAFVLMAAVWLIALAGFIVAALALGDWIVGRMRHGTAPAHPVLSMGLGLLIIYVIGIIPFIGWLLGFAALLFGMGAIVLAIWWPEPRTPQMMAEPVVPQQYESPVAPTMPTGAVDAAPPVTLPAEPPR